MRYGILASALLLAASAHAKDIPPYKNPALPTEQRVEVLLRRMTLEEKIAQMSHIHSGQILNGQQLDRDKLGQKCGKLPYGFFEGFPLTAENIKKNYKEIQRYLVEETRLGIPGFPCGESLHGVVQEGCTVYPQTIAVGSTFNPVSLKFRLVPHRTISATPSRCGWGTPRRQPPILLLPHRQKIPPLPSIRM